jgi:hypothetical protein
VIPEDNIHSLILQNKQLSICYLTTLKTAGIIDVQIGKEIPLQALTDPEDSRRLRLPDFKTIGT